MNDWYSAIQVALTGGGFNMQREQVSAAWMELSDNLKKAQDYSSLGYQGAPTMDGTADLSPLLRQSIDDMLADATTYDDSDFKVFNLIPKDRATQTMHEIRRIDSHGDRFLNLAAAEGDAGAVDQSVFASDFVQIKWWVTQRSLTYQANNLAPGGILVSGSLMSYYTKQAMTMIHRRLELDTLFGDHLINSLEIDGVVTQIEAAGEYEDLAGGQLTFDRIEAKISEKSNIDIGGKPTVLFVSPNVWHDLSRQAQAGHQRFDNTGTISGRNFTYGSTGLEVFSAADSNRKIKVVKAPFLDEARAYGSPFKPGGNGVTPVDGHNSKLKAPLPLTNSLAPANAPNGASKFLVTDAGTYGYYAIGVNAFGYTAPLTSATTPVVAGDCVTWLLEPDGSTNKPNFYYIFRTDLTGVASATTTKFVFRTPYNTDGANNKVKIFDTNAIRPGCTRALLLNFADKEEIAFYQLLPLARIPLAQTELKAPFAVFMSGAVKVKVPHKQHVWRNVGVAVPV